MAPRAESRLSQTSTAYPNSRNTFMRCACSADGDPPGLLNSIKSGIPPGMRNIASGQPPVTPIRNDKRIAVTPNVDAQAIVFA